MIATVTLNAAIDKLYLVEKLLFGEVMRVKECNYTAGGKGLNVARVAAIAGEEVVATGFLGGHAGAYIGEQLEQFNIKSEFVEVEGESRSCINILDEETGRHTELLEPGITVAPEKVDEFISRYSEVIANCSVVAISGSVPKGVDAGIYPKIIKIAKDMGKKVILDVSGKLLEAGIKAKPTMIKPNSDEIKALLGVEIIKREDLIAAAKKLHEDGIEVVAVSLGKDGALIVCDEGVFLGTTPDIKVVNTVGCGDSMIAAFAVGFARGYTIEQTIKTAVAISTASALRIETGFFVTDDYERILPQINVIKLC